jgi:H+/gluconate symporter-like permease
MIAEKTLPSGRWYRASRTFWLLCQISLAAAFLTFVYAMATMRFYAPPGPPPGGPQEIAAIALLVSIAAFVVSFVGTVSTLVLGWRAERREAVESRLRIAQLEKQAADARRPAKQRKNSN